MTLTPAEECCRQSKRAHLVRDRRLGHGGAAAAPLRRGGGVAHLAVAAQAVGADLVAVELLRGFLDLALGADLRMHILVY